MIRRNQNVGEAFIVAQEHIEGRHETLDQIGFQQEGFGFSMGDHNLHGSRLGDHALQAVRQASTLRIGGYPVFQVLGFTDIEHRAVLGQHAVHARLGRHGFKLLAQDGSATVIPRAAFPNLIR